MNLRNRIDLLEGKRCADGAGPSVIQLCDALTGEPGGALLMDGGGLTREAGESAEAFTARAKAFSNASRVYNWGDEPKP